MTSKLLGNLIALALVVLFIRWVIKRRNRKQQQVYPAVNPVNSSAISQPAANKPKIYSLGSGVYTRDDTPDEARIDELHRQATDYRRAKEWDKAIANLREAAALNPHVFTSYPIKHYLRLPAFLQYGGYFTDAMLECEKLLAETEQRVCKMISKKSTTADKQCVIHHEYCAIYAQMALLCRREKQPERAKEYDALAEQHEDEHERFKLLSEKQFEAKLKKAAEKRAARRNATR